MAILCHAGHGAVEDGEGADGAVVICAVGHFKVVLRAGSPAASPPSSNSFLLMQKRAWMGS
jgi:hypothetical protein